MFIWAESVLVWPIFTPQVENPLAQSFQVKLAQEQTLETCTSVFFSVPIPVRLACIHAGLNCLPVALAGRVSPAFKTVILV